MAVSASNSQKVKSQNRAAIMRLILSGDAVTRKDLAAATGLTKATVSVAVSELIGNGLVHEGGSEFVAAGVSGPRPTLLKIRPDARLTLGVSLSDNSIEAGLLNLTNQLVTQWSTPAPSGYGPEFVSDFIKTCLGQLKSQQREKLLGVGIAVPGIYDPSQEILVSSDILGWRNVRMKRFFSEQLGTAVVVRSKVPAMALSEYLFGKTPTRGLLLLVRVSTGIGAALVLDGRILAGHQGAAGEIGHIQVRGVRSRCRCGRAGCLEAIASVPAIHAAACARVGEVSFDEVLHRFDRDDRRVSELILSRIRHIRDALDVLVRVIAPTSVVLAGALVDRSERAFRILSGQLSTGTGAFPHVSRSSFIGWESIAGIGAVCLQSWVYNPHAA